MSHRLCNAGHMDASFHLNFRLIATLPYSKHATFHKNWHLHA